MMIQTMKKIIFYLPILPLILIAGCAKYKPIKFPEIQPEQTKTQKNVSIYKTEECKQILGKNNHKKLGKKGYQPILLYIKNNSDNIYILNDKNIDIEILPSKLITKKLTKNTIIPILT